MGIMDLFRPAPPSAQVQQTAAAAGNPAVPAPGGEGAAAGNPGGAGPAALPATGTGEQSPLAKFEELWKTDATPGAGNPAASPAFSLDHKKLREASQKIDFTTDVPPELLTKAMAGDVEAFKGVINKVAQLNFANGAAATGEFINQFKTTAEADLAQKMIPNAIRRDQVHAAVAADNPIFSDPAAAPMLASLATQLQQKYPQASPTDLGKMAKEYLAGFSERVVASSGARIVPADQPRPGQRQPDVDWEAWANAVSGA